MFTTFTLGRDNNTITTTTTTTTYFTTNVNRMLQSHGQCNTIKTLSMQNHNTHKLAWVSAIASGCY